MATKEEGRRVTRVRHGIEGDAKLADNEDLYWDKAKGGYYARPRKPATPQKPAAKPATKTPTAKKVK